MRLSGFRQGLNCSAEIYLGHGPVASFRRQAPSIYTSLRPLWGCPLAQCLQEGTSLSFMGLREDWRDVAPVAAAQRGGLPRFIYQILGARTQHVARHPHGHRRARGASARKFRKHPVFEHGVGQNLVRQQLVRQSTERPQRRFCVTMFDRRLTFGERSSDVQHGRSCAHDVASARPRRIPLRVETSRQITRYGKRGTRMGFEPAADLGVNWRSAVPQSTRGKNSRESHRRCKQNAHRPKIVVVPSAEPLRREIQATRR